MGQVKKQYQEWLEQNFPQDIAYEIHKAEVKADEVWVKRFEEAITRILGTQINLDNNEDKQ